MTSSQETFATGQRVWIMEPDGSQRAGEYLGEGTRRHLAGQARQVLVIYVDPPGADVVELERVRSQDPTRAQRPRALPTAAAMPRGLPTHRAPQHPAAIGDAKPPTIHPRADNDPSDAAARAARAADAAHTAEARAADALETAAEAHELSAQAHKLAATAAHRQGRARDAARHTRAAAQQHTAASRDRRAAATARQPTSSPA